jgi:hypothetical protein
LPSVTSAIPFDSLKAAVPDVEGFRAPTGVLNPDRYDPRIGILCAMGISDSAGSAVPTECYLTVAHAGSAMCDASG